jgi:hypothetical protein
MLVLMTLVLFSVPLSLYSIRNPANADSGSPGEFTIDVACDARTYRQNNVDPAASGSHRGDTFIVSGKIYPGGTIPAGQGVFSPDNPGSVGDWTCRGVWLVSSDELANGTAPAFDTSQIYLLPNETKQLFSEGLEGPAPTLRAVIGGTGSMSEATGQVRQELLGTNVTGLFNFRFTFKVNTHGGSN